MGATSDRRSIIVTGASSGIGAAIVKSMAAASCNVLITYSSNRAGGEKVAEACVQAGADAIAVQADVAVDAQCRKVVEAARERWGRIDALVNNAGVTRFADARDLGALELGDFERIFAVNVAGAYQMTRAAEPDLRKARGSVVNVSSHSAFSGFGSSIAYAASKGALNTMTLSLARALAPEVRVNAVCPGFVDTQWMAPKLVPDALDAFKDKVAANAPLKRIVSPADVAQAVLWFALGGPAITGQLLVIDAGTHLTVGSPL